MTLLINQIAIGIRFEIYPSEDKKQKYCIT